MERSRLYQPDVAIDAGALVEPALLHRRVDPDCDHILSAVVAQLFGIHFAETFESGDLQALLARTAYRSQQAPEIFQPDHRFHGQHVAQIITPTAVPRLLIAPSTMDLLGVELEISGHADRSHKLKNAIKTFFAHDNAAEGITYVLIDCPPSLNLLTINALAAGDAVLVPLQCEFFALEGLSQLLKTVDQVRRSLNPALTIHGIVLTMFDPRNSLAGQVVADVRAFMGDKVYDTVIPRNVRVSEAPSHGKPVLLYDLKCAGSQAYLKLASEVIQREGRWSAA